MEIDAIATILIGMYNTLELIKDQPELKRIQASEYFHTSNDLTFGDIQLALNEFLEGVSNVKNAEQIAKSN
jgi:hypothetical protein